MGEVERGCIGELDLVNYKNCLGGILCDVCDRENCNQNVYPDDRLRCFVCDSASDASCKENPANEKICPVFNENQVCVSKVTSVQSIVRGCSEQVQCENDNIYDCELCPLHSCNTAKLLNLRSVGNSGVWQDIPLTCLECEEDSCTTSENVNKVQCKNNPEQNCVTVFDGETVISRGCADPVYEKHIDHCRSNAGNCYECKSNECNSLTSKTSLTTCVTCESSTNLDCVEKPRTITPTRKCDGKCMTAVHLLAGRINPTYEVVRSCLNDKDSVDANACDGVNCKPCEGERCNIDIMEYNVLSCNHCLGDCEFVESKKCNLISNNDKCFMRFDATNTVVEMGCASKFTDEELTSNARDLFLCDDRDNCNQYNALPQENFCVLCNSNEDEACSTDPSKIAKLTSCKIPPHSSCFSKVNKGIFIDF